MTTLIVKLLHTEPAGMCGVCEVPGLVTAAEQALQSGGLEEEYSDILQDAEMVASQSGVYDSLDYDEVADGTYSVDEVFLHRGFAISNGVSSWTVARAKAQVRERASRVYTNIIRKLVMDSEYSGDIIVAQSSLSTGRIPAVQALIDAINVKTSNLEAVFTSSDSATTAAELRALIEGLPADPFPDEPDLIE
jgi:hypothetical protein